MPARAQQLVQTHEIQDTPIPAVTPVGCVHPVSETLPLAVDQIARVLNPERIILFGSYGYGAPTPDSDVDLLVIMETDATGPERSWAAAPCCLRQSWSVQ